MLSSSNAKKNQNDFLQFKNKVFYLTLIIEQRRSEVKTFHFFSCEKKSIFPSIFLKKEVIKNSPFPDLVRLEGDVHDRAADEQDVKVQPREEQGHRVEHVGHDGA